MKVFTGKVISKKMQKTATVVVERMFAHPIYKKRVKRIKKYHVHDDLGVEIGQEVKFVASRPFSKLKKWKIIEVVKKDLLPRLGRNEIKDKTKPVKKAKVGRKSKK